MTRTLTTACAILATSWIALGCSTEGANTPSASNGAAAETGRIGLALSAVSPSGVEYRLRTGDFSIWGYPNNCNYDEEGDCEYVDETVSSEDYLDQATIELDVLGGSYDIYLNSGWQLERVENGVGEVVEAQLLNSNYQYAWVQPYQTSWVTFQFGVGDEELWFTGQLSINMEVYEDPDSYYNGDCSYYEEGDFCYEECCRDYCDPSGCWGECWGQEIPCDQIPDDGGDDDGAAGAPGR